VSTDTITAPQQFRRFEEMSREELLLKRTEIEAKLRMAKLRLAEAEREGADETSLAALHERVGRLRGALQRVLAHISIRSAEKRVSTDHEIVEAARRLLSPDMFEQLVAEANANLRRTAPMH